jgi:hypothetical protein
VEVLGAAVGELTTALFRENQEINPLFAEVKLELVVVRTTAPAFTRKSLPFPLHARLASIPRNNVIMGNYIVIREAFQQLKCILVE